MEKKLERRNKHGAAAAMGCVLVLFWACAAPGPDAVQVSKGDYMDEGATIVVSDPGTEAKPLESASLLQRLQELSKKVDMESEKCALLNQQLLSLRDERDKLARELEEYRTHNAALTQQIAGLKNQVVERDRKIDSILHENRDMLERLVNLKIEKNRVEQELLKAKIAALSGDG